MGALIGPMIEDYITFWSVSHENEWMIESTIDQTNKYNSQFHLRSSPEEQ